MEDMLSEYMNNRCEILRLEDQQKHLEIGLINGLVASGASDCLKINWTKNYFITYSNYIKCCEGE